MQNTGYLGFIVQPLECPLFVQASHQHQHVQNGYSQHKPPFYPSSEAQSPKAPHSFTVQVAVFVVGPVKIALIRVNLAAKS